MSNVKGMALSTRVDFIRERFGADAYARVLTAVTPKTREILEGMVLPQMWVPMVEYADFLTTTDRLLGKGDLELVVEMGRYAAARNLPTIYKVFLRFASPIYVMSKATSIWNLNYDSGRLVTEERGPTTAYLRVEVDRPSCAQCASVRGWAEGAAAVCGVSDVRSKKLECRSAGGKACDFLLTWR
jgi:hypothetical protein